MPYPKNSAWRRGHWDKWGFWRRVWHCISVFLSFVVCMVMLFLLVSGALLAFGIQGYMLDLRDTILLGIMRGLFG